jgi:hypothetical protein
VLGGPRSGFLEPRAARVRQRERTPIASGLRTRFEDADPQPVSRSEYRGSRADRAGADDGYVEGLTLLRCHV